MFSWLRPTPEPVFILGCGRSGTTILGEALSRHPAVTYLNEPRALWRDAFPETDIWTKEASERGGKLVLTRADVTPHRARKLRRSFRREIRKSGRPLLIEKLPANSFRGDFLRAIFPEARFIAIQRHGLEVARSIAEMSERGGWFQRADYKWRQLAEQSASRTETRGLAEACDDFAAKGLLEWRLATESIAEFLGTLPRDGYHQLTYDELTRDPVGTITKVISFLGLPPNEATLEFARTGISRKSAPLPSREYSAKEKTIGGPLLTGS